MLLSKLVYMSVKNVIYYDDSDFTYDLLKDHNFETENRDYKTSLINVFAPLNAAIHRLSDTNKIDLKTAPLIKYSDGTCTYGEDVFPKTIYNVFCLKGSKYEHLPFKMMGSNKIFVQSLNDCPYFIEYREDIKNFELYDIQEGKDVELTDFGINETMCSYIVEYVKGKLMETIDPSMAAYHNNLAEQYFAGLDDKFPNFNQEKVKKVWGIE